MFKPTVESRWCRQTAGLLLLLSSLSGHFVSTARAQGRKPAVEMTSLLGAGLDRSGALTLMNFDLVFGPADGANVEITLKTAAGEEIKSFETRPEYLASRDAFSRVMVNGALYARLDAGSYLLDFVVEDELATRFPFDVVSEGDDGDAFTTSDKKQFIGPWQELAYLHFTKAHNFSADTEYKAVNFRMWGSKDDLSPDSSGEKLTATLTRDGELMGHSKEPVGFLSNNKPVNRVDMVIFQPHGKEEEANVLGVSEAELLGGDHTYQLTVKRQEDGAVIRDFTFESKGGELVPLPRTDLDHTPHHEYLAPRAAVLGSQNYEFEPVHWLQMK